MSGNERVIVMVEGGSVKEIRASRFIEVDVLDYDAWKDHESGTQQWALFAELEGAFNRLPEMLP